MKAKRIEKIIVLYSDGTKRETNYAVVALLEPNSIRSIIHAPQNEIPSLISTLTIRALQYLGIIPEFNHV